MQLWCQWGRRHRLTRISAAGQTFLRGLDLTLKGLVCAAHLNSSDCSDGQIWKDLLNVTRLKELAAQQTFSAPAAACLCPNPWISTRCCHPRWSAPTGRKEGACWTNWTSPRAFVLSSERGETHTQVIWSRSPKNWDVYQKKVEAVK